MHARVSSRILNRGSGCENGGENDDDNGGEITGGDDTERRDFEQHLLMCGCRDSKHNSSHAVPVSFDHDASVLQVTVRGGSGTLLK
ncbi:hypothetical protein DY000_02024365 [Brassica cretica]|uniref:Uncharacterized protein n=1 Tax=Brassica cretica TaxID=69181 RepID=A0ABQ7E2M6_BRACR|nr:hypothetical protein DY000_02024365 [Brassica cretica]